MIFNSEILFIHNGKTGGISCANYLMQVLPGPVYVCAANSEAICAAQHQHELVPVTGVNRHCRLVGAEAHMLRSAGFGLTAIKKILVVIRHPLSLEYSFYLHLQKPEVRERRKNNPDLLRLADGGFSNFIRHAGYHREGMPQEAFFLVDGEYPEHLELIRFESLETDFPKAVKPFANVDANVNFPHLNSSSPQKPLCEIIDDEVLELVYKKHRFMFESGLYDIHRIPQ